ncbi:DUF1491 family protein [Novosphingobium pituita]|nr:DUF1491 family protein [Novosphingobium sp. IK01]
MPDEPRLPARLEASALIRQAQAEGGFAMVVHKGDPDAGTIALVFLENQQPGEDLASLWERLPQPDGSRPWTCTKKQVSENKQDFEDYLARRTARDPDLWLLELTVANQKHFVGNGPALD